MTESILAKNVEMKTRQWIKDVIIGHNFCPFAGKVFITDAICYQVVESSDIHTMLAELMAVIHLLKSQQEYETAFIIMADGLKNFDDFLDFVELAQMLLQRQGEEGLFQLAHFHPEYCFFETAQQDAANFTNRSPFPMLHILREDRLALSLAAIAAPEDIPRRNIAYARKLGRKQLTQQLKDCQNAT